MTRAALPSTGAAARGALAAGLALAVALAACGDDGGRRIAPDGSPYAYVVPPGLHVREDVQVVAAAEDARYVTAVALDRADVIAVSAYRLAVPAERVTSDVLRQELDASVRAAVDPRARISGPRAVRTRSGTGLAYDVTGTSAPDGSAASLRIVYALRRRDEVVVVCSASRNVDRLLRACAALVGTLELR